MTDNRAPASQPKPPHICHLCQTPAGKEGRGGASQVLQVSVLRPPCMATRLGVFQPAPAHPDFGETIWFMQILASVSVEKKSSQLACEAALQRLLTSKRKLPSHGNRRARIL